MENLGWWKNWPSIWMSDVLGRCHSPNSNQTNRPTSLPDSRQTRSNREPLEEEPGQHKYPCQANVKHHTDNRTAKLLRRDEKEARTEDRTWEADVERQIESENKENKKHMWICIYIYTYIYRERERERFIIRRPREGSSGVWDPGSSLFPSYSPPHVALGNDI